MAIYLRPWFETTLNIWHGYHYLLFFAGSPVVSESPKLHKPLSRGRAVVARKAHNLEVAGSIPAPATNDIIRCVVTNKGPICAVGGLTPMRILGNDHTTMLLAVRVRLWALNLDKNKIFLKRIDKNKNNYYI